METKNAFVIIQKKNIRPQTGASNSQNKMERPIQRNKWDSMIGTKTNKSIL